MISFASFRLPALIVATLLASHAAIAQFTQQGPKLVGAGAGGASSVAISADGNTTIFGDSGDNNSTGAAWIFTRNGGVWSQQGGKLVGAGAAGIAGQGASVALSADGNIAIVGGPGDNSGAGATWVFIRNGGVWSQEGDKLIGTGAVGNAAQGSSVALSADGNTAIIGGSYDNSLAGAVWVFARSGGSWSQQGSKLVGTGAVGPNSVQGWSVALSADGNTAIVGGQADSPFGAAWVFTRSAGVWAQQGPKLVGTVPALSDNFFNQNQGFSVALSADGNTAIVGGPQHGSFFDSVGIGAAWVFTRSGGIWTQQGSNLVGTGATDGWQGWSVGLSADGNTAIVGGRRVDWAWVFSRAGGVWSQLGSKLVGTDAGGQGTSVAISGDGETAIVVGDGGAWIYVRSAASQVNYQGLWWNAAESGWGVNFAHQGDQIFATWFTYDTSGNPWWLSMLADRTPPGSSTYAGPIYVDTGPPFNNFVGTGTPTQVGTGSLTFTDANTGSFDYAVTGGGATNVVQTKAITRFSLGGAQPTCIYSASPNLNAATNYQDLWWNAAESGWGVNFAHQGDQIFATWYTYGSNGAPLWLWALLTQQGASNVYSGLLARTFGPRFDDYNTSALPPAQIVGTATATFADGNDATFAYSTNGNGGLPIVSQAKTISRYLFAGGTACR